MDSANECFSGCACYHKAANMNGRAIPGAYLFRLYVCDKEMSWPHHIGKTHQHDGLFTFETARSETADNITFRLTNVIPERIIFVSRGITVQHGWRNWFWEIDYAPEIPAVPLQWRSGNGFSWAVENTRVRFLQRGNFCALSKVGHMFICDINDISVADLATWNLVMASRLIFMTWKNLSNTIRVTTAGGNM